MPTPKPRSVVKPSRWKPALFLVGAVFVIYFLVAGEHGSIRLWQTDQDLTEWQMRVQQLEDQNDSLRVILAKLETDLEYIEKVAREEYGMAKKGERIYRIQQAPKSE